MKTIGVISDTHGLIRKEALEALRGCELIIHAGDVGAPDVLDQLRGLAPVIAVRGNVDGDRWARALPYTALVEFEGHSIYVLHVLADLDHHPPPPGVSAVIYGHSHRQSIEDRAGVLYLNPGAAGPRRFQLPVSVALLSVVEGRLVARLVEVEGVSGRACAAGRSAAHHSYATMAQSPRTRCDLRETPTPPLEDARLV